jgi:hypothetical protein
MLATKKHIDKLSSTLNEGRGSNVSSFAMKQMKKMGWTEGEGLGKNSDGINKHIKVQKRDIGEGLGVTSKAIVQLETAEDWWQNGFTSALTKISTKNGKKKRKVAVDAPTLDDLFLATGGKRMGMRARADQAGKFARTEGEYISKISSNKIKESE